MNIGDTVALGPNFNTVIGEPSKGLENVQAVPFSEASARRGYTARTAATLRPIVERRWRRMSEAHDLIRTELLARDPTHTRGKV